MRILFACLPRAIAAACLCAPLAQAIPTLEAGRGHNVALSPSGEAWAWGDNEFGKLGNGTTTSSSIPVRAGGLADVVAVSAGGDVSVALRKDGTVWTWGHGPTLGVGAAPQTCAIPSFVSPDPFYEPCATSALRVPGIAGAKAIAAGTGHVLVLLNDGTVRAWGLNDFGQVGDGTVADASTPRTVGGLSGVSAIAAGSDFSLALREDGTVWSWGNATHGELGIGATAPSTCPGRDVYNYSSEARNLPCARAPVPVAGLAQVTGISAGGRHALALRADGSLRAWGSNHYGQVGDGSRSERLSPVAVPGLANIAAIAAGFSHSLALGRDGTVWAWGLDNAGQLGFEATLKCDAGGGSLATPCVLSPARADAHSGAAAIVAGGAHSIVVRPDGTLVAFGWNSSGQLGYGSARTPTTLSAVDPHSPLLYGGSGTATSIGKPSTTGGLNLSSIDDGLSFAAQSVGTTSAAQEVRFSNLTGDPLEMDSFAVFGDFSATGDCGQSLSAYASCSLFVTFTPKIAGGRQGTLTVTTRSVYASSVSLQLGGKGTSATIPANYSDIWWNPGESGWGLTISDHESQLFAVWYTYEATGKPTWFVIPGGTFTGNRRYFSGDVYSTTGPCYCASAFDPALVRATRVGSATLDFAPPDLPSGWARFSGAINTTSWSRAITRQAFGNASPGWGSDYTDIWWNAAESGWGLALSQHGNNVFGVLFTYDCDGSPLFVALPSVAFADPSRFSGDLYTTRSAGSWWGSVAFDPADVTATRVGSATLAFTGITGDFSATINGAARRRTIVPQPFGNRGPGTP